MKKNREIELLDVGHKMCKICSEKVEIFCIAFYFHVSFQFVAFLYICTLECALFMILLWTHRETIKNEVRPTTTSTTTKQQQPVETMQSAQNTAKTQTRHQRVSIKHTIKRSQSHTGWMDGKQRTFLWIFGSHDLCMFQNVFFSFRIIYRNAHCIWLDNQSLMIVHFAV